MKLKNLAAIVFFLVNINTYGQSISQQLYGSAYVTGSSNNIHIHGSIGESSILTKSNGTIVVTEGFLQPYIKKVIIYGPEQSCLDQEIILEAFGGTAYVWYELSAPNDTLSTDSTYIFQLDRDYHIAVKSAENLFDSISITVLPIQDCPYDLMFYNFVTPNNDGDNDYFYIKNIEQSQSNELTVIDRWGNVVYEVSNYQNDWSPESLINGTYIYLFKDHTLDREHRGKIIIEK